jgi:hypothetical protein
MEEAVSGERAGDKRILDAMEAFVGKEIASSLRPAALNDKHDDNDGCDDSVDAVGTDDKTKEIDE